MMSYSSSCSSSIVHHHQQKHQLSCFSSINRTRFRLYQTLSPQFPILRSQVRVSVRSDGSNIGTSQSRTTLSYTPDDPTGHNDESSKSYASGEEIVNDEVISKPVEEEIIAQPKRAAKLHDFCLGIPFGGIVLTGGLASFIFTRNISILGTGVLFGGALLALSIFSLKVWRHGKSSLPFILGQSALAVALLWKNFQSYSLSKKIFPTGFYAVLSAAMICFYFYVVLSGGNPPPKKSKSTVVAPS